jgi:serine phosphatase RsbU (regulator of sigma subunit)
MNGSETPLTKALTQIRGDFGVDTVAVLLLDSAGIYLDTYAAVGIELTVRERVRVPMGRGFAGHIAKDRTPIAIEQVDETNVVNAILRRHGVQSLLGVPLLSATGVIGVLHVGSLARRRFDEEETRRLEEAAREVSEVILEEFSDEERLATVALQRSLLPSRLPAVPGLEMAARYLHAAGDLGGDWYDVFRLPGDRLGLVMGDVAGHGFPAAVIMGRLRSALRAYSLEYANPAQVLHHLDVKIQHFEPGVFATVLYAVAEAPYSHLMVSSAGHPAPLVLEASGELRISPVPPDLPMGTLAAHPRRTTVIDVPSDGSIVLYTDGLVERRPPATYRGELERLVGMRPTADADGICGQIVDAMFRDSPVEDDTAILVMKRLG